MHPYNIRFKGKEEIEKGSLNYRGGWSKRFANKSFRKTGKNLVKFDPDTISVFNYKQRCGDEL